MATPKGSSEISFLTESVELPRSLAVRSSSTIKTRTGPSVWSSRWSGTCNKRTGVAAALTFLEGNGVVVPEATAELHAAMIAIAERRLAKADLASLFRRLAA